MKRSLCLNLLCVGMAVMLVGTTSGCRTKKPEKGVTLIRGTPSGEIKGPGPMTADNAATRPTPTPDTAAPITAPVPVPVATTPTPPPIESSTTGVGLPSGLDSLFGMSADKLPFAANTVHFAYDSSAIASKELGKIKEVAVVLRGQPANKVVIDGHCDERGTEEYNRALGERRALSIREKLIKEGIPADRVFTRTFGKDQPLALGHDESAWSQNRRGEFILLRPPGGPAARTP